MRKEKLEELLKYESKIKDRLSDATPIKHKNRVEAYKNFLKNELNIVKRAIDKLRGI